MDDPHGPSPPDAALALADAVDALHGASSLGDLAERLARHVKRLTRCDRVTVCRFGDSAPDHPLADVGAPADEPAAAVLSFPLVVDGRPWGRVACHHRTPTRLPPGLQRACQALAVSAGYMLGWHAQREQAPAKPTGLEKSKFLSQISHELRTPLNAVLGFSQLLMADASLAPRHREQVAHIGRAGDWLLTMVADLLDLSAIETGKLKLSIAPVSLRLVVDNAAMFLGSEAARAGIRLRQEHPAEPLWALADATRLQQVMLNLISNALKYNHHGGEVRIVVRAQAEAGRVCIEVHDTGAGLTPEQVAQLFTPFNRLGREAQRIQGTGLGLVISKQLLDAMGARISVQSRVGEGSCFAVTLPLARPPASERRASPAQTFARLTAKRPCIVLYVEDDPVSTLVMKALVETVPGLEFAHAETAEAGLETALALLPAVLLIDIDLPGQPGTWLLRALRDEPALRRTPCASVTADGTPEAIERLLAAGFDECLRKPIDLDAVRAWLTRSVKPAV